MTIWNGLSNTKFYMVIGVLTYILVTLSSCEPAHASDDTIAIQTIILEAQGESLDGQIAVGETIRKRAVIRNLSHTQVCMSPKQYSAWNDNFRARNRLKSVKPKVFQRASQAWALSETSSLTKGATHYHTKVVHPYWAKGKRPCFKEGNHLFYNNVK